jgi:hypothetical protein
MLNLTQKFYRDGYLKTTQIDGKQVYHLATPCRFNISENSVKQLKENYKQDEEIGGILWAKPAKNESETVYLIDKVSFIRNDIEDTPYYDKQGKLRTRKDTYRPDTKEYNKVLQEIFSANHLPVKFHTHPTKVQNLVEHLTIQHLQTETSEQDIKESGSFLPLSNDDLLMPRALIVGNGNFSKDIFIGLYNGFIAPVNFENSKKKVQEENLSKITETLSATTLSDNQKLLLGIGAVLLLIAIAKYPKFSLPVIAAFAATAAVSLTNTKPSDKPSYFNKLSLGEANIYIP